MSDWREQAACRDMDTAVFFPSRGEWSAEAIEVCEGCPVRAECLEFALVTRQEFGIYGGTSERARKRMRKGRRGQPLAVCHTCGHVTTTSGLANHACDVTPAAERKRRQRAKEKARA